MKRFATLMGAAALVIGACGTGASSSPTPAPTPASTGTPSAGAVTPAPAATPDAIVVAVTFDGTKCTYTGPAVVPTGSTIAWTLVNTPAALEGSSGAALAVAPVVDGTTWEQIVADVATGKSDGFPAWAVIPGAGSDGLGEAAGLSPEAAAAGNTLTTKMTRNAYYIGCHTSPQEANRPYAGALIKVMPAAGAVTPAPAATPDAIVVAVTFDGTQCTYTGPAVVPTGSTIAWTLVNTPAALEGSSGAALAVAPVVDGTTWAQIVADTAQYKASDVPAWAVIPGAGPTGLGEVEVLYPESAAAGNTLTTKMTRNAYYIGCHTSPEETDKPYPGALIKVTP